VALAGVSLLILAVQANAADPAVGVWMRLDGIKGQDPSQVAASLESRGVSAVFFLVPLPATEDEMKRIRELRSSLGPGIEFHAWLTVYNNPRYLENRSDEAFISADGRPDPGWISPTSASFAQHLLGTIDTLAEDLEPDGLFLDYFYVPVGPFDNRTVEDYSSSVGINLSVANLTGNPDLLGLFLEWRNEKMIGTLQAISARAGERGLELSVFLLMYEESQRLGTGQDLARFIQHTDFLVPNTYHVAARRPASWVGGGVEALSEAGADRIRPGIQGFDISPEEIYKAVGSAIRAGAEGLVLFRWGTMSPDHWDQVDRALRGGLGLSYLIVLGVAVAAVPVVWVYRHRTSPEKPSRKKRGKHRRRR
jgi:hypothetical protein